jgi:signal transduction histidine kinase/DNA-binding response OmpR family regulator
MLTNPGVTWGMTAVVAALIIAVGRPLDFSAAELSLPLFMLLITTAGAWLSARRLFTALGWAFEMSTHAQRSAEEARDHRGELQRLLRSLDLAYTQLERTNQQLIFAQEAADQAYRFKSDFVANVSHELRTPLNLIVGFSEMMVMAPESYGGVELPRQYRGDLMAIYRSARHLLDLINDVLDLSQIEAGRMAVYKERTDLGEVVREAADIVRGLAEARRLRLELELPPDPLLLELDRIRIRQVLLNLLTNAMRYTDAGWVRVAVEMEHGKILVTVADSGRGIAAEKLPRAFEAFDRLDEEQLREGTGLGLAVSKKFVELHDGHMWIESQVGAGTTVSFTLPLPNGAGALPPAPLRLTQPLPVRTPRPLILVLHDDLRALTLLRRHVSECDFVLAETPEQVTELLQTTLPNAVLMDAAWAARRPHFAATMTTAAQAPVLTCPLPSVHHLGTLMGATDYLPKPVTRADLAAALARLPQAPRLALVVDDDPHVVRLIGRMLSAIDPTLRVLETYSGEEALAVAQAQRPDVIFLDLVMPQVSGYNLIDAVAADPNLAATALVVVSVRSVEEESAAIGGELRLEHQAGFTLTELLQALRALLASVTQPGAVSPASAAARLATPSGSPAW